MTFMPTDSGGGYGFNVDPTTLALLGLASGMLGTPKKAGFGPALGAGIQGAMSGLMVGQSAADRRRRMEEDAQDRADRQALAREKMDMLKAAAASKAADGQSVISMLDPGFSAQPSQQVQFGPDLQTAGAPMVDYLVKNHGLTPTGAAGVVGNLYQESKFNPTAVHDNGTGYGMGGWRLDRREKLVQFAQTQGKQPADPNVQLDFLVSEMKGGDMGAQRAFAMLQQAKTPEDATTAMMHYFRPAGYTPANPTGGDGFQNRVQYTTQLAGGGAPAAQGGRQIPQGDAVPTDAGRQQGDILKTMPPEMRELIKQTAVRDPGKARQMLLQYMQEQKKVDAFYPLTEDDAKMFLGKAHDPTKAYQRNRVTGKIEQIGGGGQTVNIDQKGQSEFSKQMGKMDAERFGKIIESEGTLNDMAAKVGFALDQLKQTYTGPAGETANAFFKILGSAGVDSAKDKANAADAGMAVISQMKPYMRASGSGASSDKDMDMFARALPSLLNMPGGNERIGAYFQRLADRATEIRRLAQEHSEGGKVPLTGTKFDDAVKALGPLFTPEEREELSGLSKKPTADRPPISSFGRDQSGNPLPTGQRPPLSSFGR